MEEGSVWPKLRKLDLGTFQTSEDGLFGLLERHARTLKIFWLQMFVELDAGGSWPSLLRRMKDTLKLEGCRFNAVLKTGDPNNYEDEWRISNVQEDFKVLKCIWNGQMEDYLVEGRPFSLID